MISQFWINVLIGFAVALNLTSAAMSWIQLRRLIRVRRLLGSICTQCLVYRAYRGPVLRILMENGDIKLTPIIKSKPDE